MNWYYVDNGRQAGPIDESQLDELRASGRITGETLVWKEGMANWLPHDQVRQSAPTSPAVAPGAPAAFSSTSSSESGESPRVTCTQCGGVFPQDETIRYGTVHVCANCKPIFMQKLQEGARLHGGALEYASILSRLGAIIIDSILLYIVGLALEFVASPFMTATPEDFGSLLMLFALMALQIAIAATYETLMVGAYGATLGKMALKIRVVTAEGGRVSYARALGRYFAKILSQIICLIGYLMAIFDKEERRALHDRICNTRVVVK